MSNDAKPDNSPNVVTAVCRFCGGQAAGLDRLCTPCRAESACTGLTDDLTDARENFFDGRLSPGCQRQPHQFGYPPPAYYLDAPAFGGDSSVHDAEIITPSSRSRRTGRPRPQSDS